MRRLILMGVIMVVLAFRPACGLCASGLESSDGAAITIEAADVHSGTSEHSRIIKSLKKGEKVTVEIEMQESEDRWCGIIEQGRTDITGYVRCRYLERRNQGQKIWRQVGSQATGRDRGTNETNVTIMGNSVLLPVTLGYKDKTVEAMLLIDTGASISMIHTDTADRLGITPAETKVESGQVAGGGMILLFTTRLGYIAAGPHTKRDIKIGVVAHDGPPVEFDGLLGMDFLKGLKYYIDFDSRVIKWEQ